MPPLRGGFVGCSSKATAGMANAPINRGDSPARPVRLRNAGIVPIWDAFEPDGEERAHFGLDSTKIAAIGFGVGAEELGIAGKGIAELDSSLNREEEKRTVPLNDDALQSD